MYLERNRLLSACILAMAAVIVMAQDVNRYYRAANGKKGEELKTALYKIIQNPSVVVYDSLWTAYKISDARPMGDSLIIWDIYSNISRYSIDFTQHKNSIEGVSGFQREHSMPKSWFNPKERTNSGLTYADIKPMYSDIVHVIPTDGTVNNKRSNNAYGEITDSSKVDWQSAHGFSKQSKKGGCGTPGWQEYMGADAKKARVFEPNNEYKGDLARIYFYMVTCYEDLAGTWSSPMFDSISTEGYQPFAQWAFDMLVRWSKQDPVSEKEIARNEACYQLQGNRNPFVDFPGLEDYIWGDKQEDAFECDNEELVEMPDATDSNISLNSASFAVDWSENENLRDYYSRSPISFEQNGITVTFAYGVEGKYMYADTDHIRLYNGNTLTLKAHNGTMEKVEFITGYQDEGKNLTAETGTIEGNTWKGESSEIRFSTEHVASVYNYSTKKTIGKYLEIAGIRVTTTVPSGIQFMENTMVADHHTYTLSGTRVDGYHLPKGIYIKDGKKFIIK